MDTVTEGFAKVYVLASFFAIVAGIPAVWASTENLLVTALYAAVVLWNGHAIGFTK